MVALIITLKCVITYRLNYLFGKYDINIGLYNFSIVTGFKAIAIVICSFWSEAICKAI